MSVALRPVAADCAEIVACRGCGGRELASVFDLGRMPLSDGFTAEAVRPDPAWPLEVVSCVGCGLAQLRHTVAPEVLFADDYPYFSSVSRTVVDNAARNVAEAVARFRPAPGALAIELASNDGYLLRHARDAGLAVLGIDPARGPVAAARAAGIETLHAFFTEELAQHLAGQGRRAALLFANNVLAHVADTRGFVRGIRTVLAPGGTAIIEVPYLRDLIDHVEFDTIYHEHLCYFSLTALVALFAREGLALNDAQRIPIHGGSLRLFVQREAAPSPRLAALLAQERAEGLDRADAFRGLAGRVAELRRGLRALLDRLAAQGARIGGYGAAAKGTILLNHFGIGRGDLLWVADRNPHKHGLFVPGVKLPIVPVERIAEDRPTHLLLLPWNHRAEILQQQAAFLAAGGRFILPIPEPVVVEG
ncbi:class I SAM-dependent methyltransferase [Falsiroseomonas oryzae]|uniref:class I SAM-dependent methyltransferase n=1 Tax=Falsiroseomonas oryzae TaxID=2766473 RepID=UPI0022EB81D6|nr:class I SAM-dependent methyltransferase [Roseomonas sp. MO-31]